MKIEKIGQGLVCATCGTTFPVAKITFDHGDVKELFLCDAGLAKLKEDLGAFLIKSR